MGSGDGIAAAKTGKAQTQEAASLDGSAGPYPLAPAVPEPFFAPLHPSGSLVPNPLQEDPEFVRP